MSSRGESNGAQGGSTGAVQTLEEIVAVYVARHFGIEPVAPVRVLDSEMMVSGRPGVLDIVAEVGREVVHLPIGLRVPGDESHLMPEADDPVLGLYEDEAGLAVAVEAAHDSQLAELLLRAVTGGGAEPALVRQLRMDASSVTLAIEDRLAFTVYTELTAGHRLALEMLTALDGVGFNHIPAPLAVWGRGGRDLGLVQEYLPGAAVGWALAMTSVRDLYASGGPPELAGADFGAEAQRLGTMAGRMHLALAEAFGRREGQPGTWADGLTAIVADLAPTLADRSDVGELIAALRSVQDACVVIRTHGDFHLGRVYRTEQGWYVGDLDPGGIPSTRAGTVSSDPSGDLDPTTSTATNPIDPTNSTEPVFRSPLADVSDMLWSFGHVATRAADERDPTGREGLVEMAVAWERRNRRSFLEGYLEVPGIGDIVPPDEQTLRAIESALELEHTAMAVSKRRR